jgi:homoserine kinase
VDVFRVQLPATSANLGAAFDTAAVALGLHLKVEAETAEVFSIEATGRNVNLCARLEDNLILDTYRGLLVREGRVPVPLALRMENQIPLGMGCGSSAAGRLAAIALADHFGRLGWTSEKILTEACLQEGHPDNAAACWLGGMVVAACEGEIVHVAKVEPPRNWRAMLVMPDDPLATSKARSILPANFSQADVVANIQAAALLGLAFGQGRSDLIRPAMRDRIHQPFREEICPLLPALLPLAGHHGILGVALSGAGPSVLLILSDQEAEVEAKAAVEIAVDTAIETVTVDFESRGGCSSIET